GRRFGVVGFPDDHRDRADLALGDPADVVLEEPLGDTGGLTEVAERVRFDVHWSSASRSALTKSYAASGPPRMTRATSALPTMTPSASASDAAKRSQPARKTGLA